MSDLERVETLWRPWIGEVAGALGVDPELVDVSFIHSMTQVVAHEFERPMAPVAAYLLGLAVAAHPEKSPDQLRTLIVGALPEVPVES